MLGEFIIRILVLVFGYLYPAFECFRTIERTIERNRPDTEHLLFWCQYWIIVAAITALEKFGDIFVSWVPLYGESKLAFIIYLWHPKTKGTSYVYHRVVRPFMAQHESDMEKRLHGMMSKSIDLLLFYIKHFTDKGQSIAFEILQQVVSRSMGGGGGSSSSSPEKVDKRTSEKEKRRITAPEPPPLPPKSTVRERTWFKRSTRHSPSVEQSAVEVEDKDEEVQLNRIEEAFRAAGVNLREISRTPTRNRENGKYSDR